MNTQILIVEDDGILILRLERMLIKWGYEPLSASSYEKAIKIAKEFSPELALMDVQLNNKLDGIDVAETLRDRFAIPSIYLTAFADNALLERARETKPYGYLVKPVQDMELRATLEMALSRRRLDKQLIETKDNLQMALEAVNAGLWRYNMKTKEVYFDKRFWEILGYNQNDFLPPIDKSIHHPDELFIIKQKMEDIRQGKTLMYNNELRIMTKNGEQKWIRAWAKVSEWDKNGSPLQLVGAAIDIDRRKRAREKQQHLEDQLRQSQKMEAVGQLAGGVAHDFNNLLYIIMGYADMMRDEIPVNHPLYFNVNEILKATTRAKTLVRQLLLFSRKESMKPEYLDMNALISELIKMLRRIIGEHINLEIHPGFDLKTIYADSSQIEQIIMNLCVNARDAMPIGGTISIETENINVGPDFCEKYPWSKPGEYICLTVSDSGQGMTPEIKDKVFEPFFTTKEIGKGTGLGLAAAYGIVKSHNGMIHVYSEPDKGSVFRVYLPASEKQDMLIKKHVEMKPIITGSETILVAEDEEGVRDFTFQLLQRAGYQVLTACDGKQAIEVFNENEQKIDLALLDVVMPKAGGTKVYEHIRQANINMPVIFITGYSKGMLPSYIPEEMQHNIIQKPIRVSDLLKKVRDCLDNISQQV